MAKMKSWYIVVMLGATQVSARECSSVGQSRELFDEVKKKYAEIDEQRLAEAKAKGVDAPRLHQVSREWY